MQGSETKNIFESMYMQVVAIGTAQYITFLELARGTFLFGQLELHVITLC